ncbi:MAG: ATP synthase F1 subunit delta [Pirellulales bacterium]
MADGQQNGPRSNGFDAGQQYLGNVYAKALLGVTEQAGNTEQVVDEFESFVKDVLDRLPDFESLLRSPRVAHAEKERLLDRALAGKMSVELLNFLKVVSRHGRLDCLRMINRSVRRLVDELRGRIEVEITTAADVEGEVLEGVRNRLAESLGKQVSLVTRVRPEILGGLLIRIGDKVYDGSVKNRLERMREETTARSLESMRRNLDRLVVAN